MIQTLNQHDIPPTQIAQLSHKNAKSIENYSTVSTTDAHVKRAKQCGGRPGLGGGGVLP